MSSSLPVIDASQLATWLGTTTIAYLELRGPGVEWRLLQRDDSVEPAPAGFEPRAPRTALAVVAPSVGRVRYRHPMQRAPLIAPGQAVKPGQTLALLEIGALLLPVVAPDAGVVAAMRVADGAIVGYGTPLVDLVSTADATQRGRPVGAD